MRLTQPTGGDQLSGVGTSRLEPEFVIDHRHHAARFEDAKESNQHLCRAPNLHSDGDLRSDAPAPQPAGKAIRTLIELSVGQRVTTGGNGDGVWCARDLLGKPLLNRLLQGRGL